MRHLRYNGDREIRGLQRRWAQGDVSAAGRLALEQARTYGKIDTAWLKQVLDQQGAASVAIHDAFWQGGVSRQLHDAYGELLFNGLVEDVLVSTGRDDAKWWRGGGDPFVVLGAIPERLGQGEPDAATGDAQLVPDMFGRPVGMILSIAYRTGVLRGWSTYGTRAVRKLPLEERKRRLGTTPSHLPVGASEHGKQPWFQVMAATRFDPSVHHPFHFYVHNHGELRTGDPLETPVRISRQSILLEELVTLGPPGPRSVIGDCVNEVVSSIKLGSDLASEMLQEVAAAGVRLGDDAVAYADAIRIVHGMESVNNYNYNLAKLVLAAVRPPPRPDLDAILLPQQRRHRLRRASDWPEGSLAGDRALNATGRGVFHQAMIGLGTAVNSGIGGLLSGQVDLYPMFPFAELGRGVSEHRASYELSVRSSRARRTLAPLIVRVTFDTMNGHWAHLGGHWRGNQLPPGGLWELQMGRKTPATVRAFARPIEAWIKSRFPGAEVTT